MRWRVPRRPVRPVFPASAPPTRQDPADMLNFKADPLAPCAVDLIHGLKPGDRVRYSDTRNADGLPTWLEMTVRDAPRRHDHPFGSAESVGVTLTVGPGRYSRRVDVEGVARGAYLVELVEGVAL